MQENRISFEDLPKKDQVRLCAVYGSQPKNGYTAYRIEYVRELTPYEAWFFGRGNFLSPSFLTQTLYKLKGTLSPLLFNRILRDYEAQEDVLRTNYCDIGDRVLAVVTKERKNTEPVIYNNRQGREPEEIDEMLAWDKQECEFTGRKQPKFPESGYDMDMLQKLRDTELQPYLDKMGNCELVLLPGIHCIYDQRPDDVAEIISDFLERIEEQTE